MRLRELRMDWKVVTTIIVSTLLLTIDYYHRLFPYHVLDRLFLYLVIPLIIIILFYRESPAKYGFRIGDWRAGMVITSIGILGAAVVIFFVAQTDVFQEYYAPLANLTIPMPIYTALELFGWEFLFRGFLLFSLYTVIGPYAIVLQAVPFALAHLGKPELETMSTILGGTVFGYIAWRTGSFYYPFLIHWFILTATIFIASGGMG